MTRDATTGEPVTATREVATKLAGGDGGVAEPLRAPLEELAASTDRLLTTVRTMSDEDAAAPSQLPG